MKGDVNAASKLSSVDSKKVDLAFIWCDQEVVFAGVDIEAGDAAIINQEFIELCFLHNAVSDVDRINAYLVRRWHR